MFIVIRKRQFVVAGVPSTVFESLASGGETWVVQAKRALVAFVTGLSVVMPQDERQDGGRSQKTAYEHRKQGQCDDHVSNIKLHTD
jgi:hypothetical protein